MPALDEFPRPNVAVDLVVFTAADGPGAGGLRVLVLHRSEDPAGVVLPGTFLRDRETVAKGVTRLLRDKVGALAPEAQRSLLTVSDAPDRDPRAWTLAVVEFTAFPDALARTATGTWLEVDDRGRVPTDLLFDHEALLAGAATKFRDQYETAPDPGRILPAPFTMQQLHHLHQNVLGAELRWDTFKRRMEPQLEAVPPPEGARHVGRPPKYYSHRPTTAPEADTLWRLPGEGGGVPRPAQKPRTRS